MKIAVIGTNETACRYLTALCQEPAHTLVGIIDPLKEGPVPASCGEIPVYDSVAAFYEQNEADLVILATPVGYHKKHGMAVFPHSSMLCAAPLMGEQVYAVDLKQEAIRYGRQLGVGFSWCYTPAMQACKRDIQNGLFGRALVMKGVTADNRPISFYENSPFRGKLYDEGAKFHVLDGVVTDTAMPLLQNMFDLNHSYWKDLSFRLFRSHAIETFDTAFIKGTTENGCRFFLAASAAADVPQKPVFTYEFENGTVSYDGNREDVLRAIMADGSEQIYGPLLSAATETAEIAGMTACLESGGKPACDADDTFPQLILCNTLFDHVDEVVPETARHIEGDTLLIPGLTALLTAACESETLPDTLG